MEIVTELKTIAASRPEATERTRLTPAVGPQHGWQVICLALDAAMLALACVTATIGSSAAGVGTAPVKWLVIYPILVLLLFHLRHMYRLRLRVQILDEVRGTLTATALAAMAVISARALVADDPNLVGQTVRLWAFSAVYLTAGRVSLAWALSGARRHDRAMLPTLIVGAGRIGKLTARRLQEHAESGLRPIGFLDKEPLDDGDDSLPVLGASWDLERVVREHGVRHVVIAFSTAPRSGLPRHRRPLRRARRDRLAGAAPLREDDRPGDRRASGRPAADLGTPRGPARLADRRQVRARPRRGGRSRSCWSARSCWAPAAAVAISLGRPIFYRQRRVGLDGATVRHPQVPHDASRRAGARLSRTRSARTGSRRAASRATIGAPAPARSCAARRSTSCPSSSTSLRGEMSLVGPRPERPELVATLRGRASTATTSATASRRASPAGRRCTACVATRLSPTGSSGTTTTSSTGRSGSTSRSCS